MIKNSHSTRRGFTIIEMVVVVAVIGILAAISIVGYGAWKKQTLTNQVKSDLTAVASAMESARNFDDKYPANVPSSVKSSDSVNFVGGGDVDGATYCVSKTSADDSTIQFFISSANRSTGPQTGGCPVVNGGVVTTLAGSTSGFADGTGVSARFNSPSDIAVDSSGTLYVADGGNNRIRKITSAGVATTLAGSATSGSADGTGSVARFTVPAGITVDSAGTVYVSDTQNDLIRKITPAGVVTTLAGSTSGSAFVDGTGSAARFYYPVGIVLDSLGNLFVADSYNFSIRKITPAGVVTTFAGTTYGYLDGTGTAARFTYVNGLGIDSSDNLYVSDMDNNRIRKITPAGVVTTFAGSSRGFADGTGAAAQFSDPLGVTVSSSGIVYVADQTNNRIRKITPAGVVTTLAGATYGYADGTATAARFAQPFGLTVDSSGVVYVADLGNNRIRKIQ